MSRAPRFRIIARVRGSGLGGPDCRRLHISMVAGQPLLLEREPTNHVDERAVVVKTILGGFVGYIDRDRNAEIARRMDAGEVLLAKVFRPAMITGPKRFRVADAVVWSDGEDAVTQTNTFTNDGNPCLDIDIYRPAPEHAV